MILFPRLAIRNVESFTSIILSSRYTHYSRDNSISRNAESEHRISHRYFDRMKDNSYV